MAHTLSTVGSLERYNQCPLVGLINANFAIHVGADCSSTRSVFPLGDEILVNGGAFHNVCFFLNPVDSLRLTSTLETEMSNLAY